MTQEVTITAIENHGDHYSFQLDHGIWQNVPIMEIMMDKFIANLKVGDKVNWHHGRNRYAVPKKFFKVN